MDSLLNWNPSSELQDITKSIENEQKKTTKRSCLNNFQWKHNYNSIPENNIWNIFEMQIVYQISFIVSYVNKIRKLINVINYRISSNKKSVHVIKGKIEQKIL